jgi:hypothetical protein
VENSDGSDIVRRSPFSRISGNESDDPKTDQNNRDNSGGDEDDNSTNQVPTYHEVQVDQDKQYQNSPGYETPLPQLPNLLHTSICFSLYNCGKDYDKQTDMQVDILGSHQL